MQYAPSFQEMYTFLGLSAVFIKWQFRNWAIVSFSGVFVPKVSSILKSVTIPVQLPHKIDTLAIESFFARILIYEYYYIRNYATLPTIPFYDGNIIGNGKINTALKRQKGTITLFSERSAHENHPTFLRSLGHRPRARVILILSIGLESNLQKTPCQNLKGNFWMGSFAYCCQDHLTKLTWP